MLLICKFHMTTYLFPFSPVIQIGAVLAWLEIAGTLQVHRESWEIPEGTQPMAQSQTLPMK